MQALLLRRHRLAVGVDDVDLVQVQRAHRRLDLLEVADHDPHQLVGIEGGRGLLHLLHGQRLDLVLALEHVVVRAVVADDAAQAQAAIKEEFAFFADWSERYQYLIDLGRKLPPFPDAWKTEEHRLLGCQSLVWIVPQGDAQRLDFHAISDSAIVSGLIFLALRVYSGRSAAEILATEPDYIADIGLARHLSPTRSNGLAALLAFIRDTARRQA